MLTCAQCCRVVVSSAQGHTLQDLECRADGRRLDEVRPLECELGVLPELHGSALFSRGETQVLATTILDDANLTLPIDPSVKVAVGAESEIFSLMYEYPPYTNNEVVRFFGRASRREVGHGNIGWRGLAPTIDKTHPFAIRTTAVVTSSHGSSSMATVCAGALSLVDAAVPIKEMVAGIASGLFSPATEGLEFPAEYKILTDITGMEDMCGDMDLKVAGTRTAITTCQLDVKRPVPLEIICEALATNAAGRAEVLEAMEAAVAAAEKTRTFGELTGEVKVGEKQRLMQGRTVKEVATATNTSIAQDYKGRVIRIVARNPEGLVNATREITACLNNEEGSIGSGGGYGHRNKGAGGSRGAGGPGGGDAGGGGRRASSGGDDQDARRSAPQHDGRGGHDSYEPPARFKDHVVVPKQFRKMILGYDNKRLNTFEAQTGSKMDIVWKGANGGVSIKGTSKEAVDAGVALIQEFVARKQEAKRDTSQDLYHDWSRRDVPVPPKLHAGIIGPRGSHIRELQQMTGARFQLNAEQGVVTVRGPCENRP